MKEYCIASHEDMLISAEDDDIEYNVELLW